MPSDLIIGKHGLMDTVCHCGRPKGSKMSFCVGCYAKLPRDYQLGLYRLVGHGYEAAHARAIAQLVVMGRITPNADRNGVPHA